MTVSEQKEILKPYIDAHSDNTALGAALRSSGKITNNLLEVYTDDEQLGVNIREYYDNA